MTGGILGAIRDLLPSCPLFWQWIVPLVRGTCRAIGSWSRFHGLVALRTLTSPRNQSWAPSCPSTLSSRCIPRFGEVPRRSIIPNRGMPSIDRLGRCQRPAISFVMMRWHLFSGEIPDRTHRIGHFRRLRILPSVFLARAEDRSTGDFTPWKFPSHLC